MGAGSIHVEHLAASLYGNCQPEVFRRNVAEASADGIVQRFFPVILNAGKNAMWQKGRPDFMSCRGEYEQLIKRTFLLPEFEYVLADDAMVDFRTFGEWCLGFRDCERHANHSSTYQTALGKLEGNAARLILLMHLMTDPFNPFVSADTVKKSIRLVHRFFLPMLRHAFLEIGGQRDVIGVAIFDAVIQMAGAKATVTLGELRRSCRQIDNNHIPVWQSDAMIRSAMDEMAGLGYVKMHQDSPRNPEWALNPEVADLFANERKRIIHSKQSNIERIREDIFKKAGVPANGLGSTVGLKTVPDL
jgi:hypothetical protein